MVGVHVGVPRTIQPEHGRAWTSAVFKDPVAGPVVVTPDGLEGDEQADRRVHGGPDKAVCAYPALHYGSWERRLGLGLGPGAFGENITVDGLDEADVCIGDRHRLGTALVEVSQPRSPCHKIARRWEVHDLAAQFQGSGWTGWYWRVIAGGTVAVGHGVRLVDRPHPGLTVAEVNVARWHAPTTPAMTARLAATAELADGWRRRFAAPSAP